MLDALLVLSELGPAQRLHRWNQVAQDYCSILNLVTRAFLKRVAVVPNM